MEKSISDIVKEVLELCASGRPGEAGATCMNAIDVCAINNDYLSIERFLTEISPELGKLEASVIMSIVVSSWHFRKHLRNRSLFVSTAMHYVEMKIGREESDRFFMRFV